MARMNRSDRLVMAANVAVFAAFLYLLLVKTLLFLPHDVRGAGIHIWAYTDWLIDYSSGFTRRGLSGELVRALTAFAGPRAVVGALAWSVFGLVVFGYLRLVVRSARLFDPLLLAAMLFLPSFVPFYLYDHRAFGRKETIGFVVLLWHLSCIAGCGKRDVREGGSRHTSYLRSLLPVTVALLPAQILVHEASFLLFVPMHMIMTNAMLPRGPAVRMTRRAALLALLYLPVLVATFAVLAFGRPGFDAVLALCKRWELAHALAEGSCRYSDTLWALPGSFAALPWSLAESFSLTLSFTAKAVPYWISVFSILGTATAYVCMLTTAAMVNGAPVAEGAGAARAWRHSRAMCRTYFLLPLVLSAPLYLVGWDWGRWFAVTCLSFAMVSLSREINCREFGSGTGDGAEAMDVARSPAVLRRGLVRYVILGIALLVSLMVRLPHCCINADNLMGGPLKPALTKLIGTAP